MAHFLIFGGSGGVGSTLASQLISQGNTVHITGRNAQRTQQIAQEIGASFTVCDVLDDERIQTAVAQAGPVLDGLAYAIGTINLKPVARLTAADFLNDYAINALSAAKAIQSALPTLKSSPVTASILLFSSIAVAQGFTNHASISMAKGAIEGLTRALSAELAPKIRVNAIAPSLTQTPLAASLTSNPAIAQGIAALHALPRLGTTDDIASLGSFLLGPQSGWITGQVIAVDGGRSRARTKG